MDKIFVMNLGTTSFKFKLYLFDSHVQEVLAEGELESVGAELSHWVLSCPQILKREGQRHVENHADAFAHFLTLLEEDRVLKDLSDLDAVGYKAVHGGNLSGIRPVDDTLMEEVERMIPLAPAHNPIYLSAMKTIRDRFPKLKQFARFETSFHSTIPDFRTTYGVPFTWREEMGIRKYGFHGSSHQYIAEKMLELKPSAARVISCHLGGSSSICAIQDGRSIATTMGATPQSGLFNNNRVGDFDVFAASAVMQHEGCNFDEVLKLLSTKAGLLGISGVSNDLREVITAMDAGNSRAKLAADTFVDNIVGYIGMYIAYLDGLDAIVFTGGIGYNSAYIRQRVCERFGYMGLLLNSKANSGCGDSMIASQDSRVSVWRLKTNEELVVARCVWEYLHA